MRMHRLINILLSLDDNKKITAGKLAEQLEISVRTVYRDIDTLCEAGIPIIAESGPKGGISLTEGYLTKIQHFDKEDIIHLYLNGLGVKAERSAQIGQQSDNTMKKLLQILPENDSKQIHGLAKRFVVDNSPWWGKKQSLPYLDAIVQAVWELYKINICYEKMNGHKSTRRLRPYGIVIKDHIWYLVAYCEKSLAVRIFRFDRIVECVLSEETFIYPEDFVPEEFFEAQKKDFVQGRNLAEQYVVTLRCPKEAFRLLDGLEFTQDDFHQEGNEYTIRVNLYTLDNAMNDYWNLLIKSCVLDPPQLREAVKKCLEAALIQYT